ncbi:hypothetical protein [Lysinibacillus sp. fls2-241-R2A-57]|uniref:hypothetical protein n=1 Tax=Lysinibacillus sp. fls2-241-R2A-57 TaxID=3040292 RepID=UPI002554DAE0|nr:hypothetical protein [Lysinibacillus sp. fls2-241-R2A-57]
MNSARFKIKNKKVFKLFTMLLSFIFSLVLFVMLININISKIEINSAKKFNNQNMYQITDMLINEREIEFFKEVQNYDVLNEFKNHILENNKVDVYSTVWQPIGLKEYPNDEKFAAYYESELSDALFDLDGNSYRASKAIQVNKSVFDYNVFEFAEGKRFDDSSYLYTPGNNSIPIILGSDYNKYYELNDKLELYYYGEHFVGEVIGFAKENTSIFTKQEPQQLINRFIILPSLSFSENPSELLRKKEVGETFVKALLLSQTNSNLVTQLNPLEVKKEIAEIEKVTGFSDYQIIGANSLSVNLLHTMIDSNQTIIYTISGVVFVLILIALYFLVKSTIKREFDTYLVYIINGITNNKIKQTIQVEFLTHTGIGIALALLLTVILLENTSILSILVFAGLIVWLLLGVVANVLVSKLLATTNVIEKLKGD